MHKSKKKLDIEVKKYIDIEVDLPRKSCILVVLDIHLGAHHIMVDNFPQQLDSSKLAEFFDLLRQIRDNILEKVEILIILGDFIDLLMDMCENIVNDIDFDFICQVLNDINEKAKIIFVLGNHETSVTGFYNKKFERRKNINCFAMYTIGMKWRLLIGGSVGCSEI